MLDLALLTLSTVVSPTVQPPLRPLPPSVQSGDTVRHFAYGSNLLLSKLVNRGANGTTIEVLGREPASVVDHRLAFNLRMFPPLEPAMASIEPCAGATCEGALYTLSRAAYEALWRSEGGAMERPGYEEVVVTAVGSDGAPVQALTLRAAPWMRLRRDAIPSERYKGIIVDGARELGLSAAYVQRLSEQPAMAPSAALTALARAHGIVAVLAFRAKQRRLLAPIRVLCYGLLYTGRSRLGRLASECAIALVLLPTALVGATIRLVLRLMGREPIAFGPPAPKQQKQPA